MWLAAQRVSAGQWLADPYRCSDGPSAVLAPGYPLLFGAVHAVSGQRETTFRIMALIACVVSSLAYALLPWLAVRLGLSQSAGIVSGWIGALLPMLPGLEAHGPWEAPLVALLCVVAVGITARGPAVAAGLTWGIAFLVGPSLLPVLLCIVVALPWRRAVLIGGVALLTVTPWLARNYYHFGSLFWIRSGLGLELALSHNDNAKPTFSENWTATTYALHPANPSVCPEVRRTGEVAYFNMLARRALAWILDHPKRAALLTAQRIWYWWRPPLHPWFRGDLSLALGLLAFFGLTKLRGLARAVSVGALVAYPLLYYSVQSDTRYRVPVEPLLLLTAGVGGIEAASRRFTSDRRNGRQLP